MPSSRLHSIDLFRGFAILTMVPANFMTGIKVIPAWLKHTPDVGLTVIDLIAPLFIFAIGLTYGMSFRRRLERDRAFLAYTHFFTRFAAIIGLGAVVSAAQTAVGLNPEGIDWGVLQAIGMAGLVALLVIRLPAIWRWIAGLGMLLVYQVLLDRFALGIVLRSPHGGFFGSFSWAAMLILSTALADLFFENRRRFLLASVLVLVAGSGLAFLSPLSKPRVSSTYVLVSLAVSALLFLLFYYLVEKFDWNSRFLMAWGKNPLVLYFLHYVFIGLVFIPGIPFLYTDAPLWLVLLEMVALIGGISAVAYWMERRNIVVSL